MGAGAGEGCWAGIVVNGGNDDPRIPLKPNGHGQCREIIKKKIHDIIDKLFDPLSASKILRKTFKPTAKSKEWVKNVHDKVKLPIMKLHEWTEKPGKWYWRWLRRACGLVTYPVAAVASGLGYATAVPVAYIAGQ